MWASVIAQSPVISTVNWPLRNLDLAGGRFSAMDQIDTSNVATLSPRWLFQHGVIDGVSNQTTPVVVDGSMYVTDPRGSVYALDAADGHLLWTFDVTERIGGGAKGGYIFQNRGVCYADGVVYTAAGSFLFALDARTGKPIRRFGTDGQASVILDVIRTRYPDVTTAITLGYWFTTAPQVHDGVIYIGSTRSESHIPGGHVLAVDATIRQVLWHFNTIPQDEHDQGWQTAGPHLGGRRTPWRRDLGDAVDRSRNCPAQSKPSLTSSARDRSSFPESAVHPEFHTLVWRTEPTSHLSSFTTT